MLTQTKTKTQAKLDSYYDGEFDAAIALPPKFREGQYWRGYLAKANQTGNTPF
ncbi:hypothetical protein [aff. Roholtiella sp. LEGE 12411]|uniref:hypothetical protein n=1 Tax=aff. Roholtiella sp. LEGE 12411 TaxID=1828822 RepID=UPI00187E4D23|nr:hypothetical protein [aff. Roholtiella sp. LEGE 12411]MBE9038717.1 hypothetical protein [aff. Roholtiella sp. LEGE 12411]